MIEGLVLTCVIAITTPQGERICIKPDGKVEMPDNMALDEASRKFWDELAKVYVLIKNEKCI